MDTLTGRTIGPYKILEKIGRGGMAEVYRGFHPALERYVAIKLLGRSLQTDPAFTRRFQREAQTVASLRHANIIQVFNFGSFKGGHYIAMEFVEGEDLRVEMDRRRLENQPFTPDETLQLLDQIADALDYAHRHGVVHRDIKPANILLTSDGQVVLGDFGLAMLRNRLSQVTMGHSFGTPEYIAPEQAIDSRAAVPQSDIYALGAILYEIVTGQPPFYAESPLSLALMHVNEEPTPPSHYAPGLPPPVEAVILRALAKDPEERFPTAQAMVATLRRAWSNAQPQSQEEITHLGQPLAGSIPAPPPPPPSSPPTRINATLPLYPSLQRRWPLIAAGTALLLITGLCLLSLFFLLLSQNRESLEAVTATTTSVMTFMAKNTNTPYRSSTPTETFLPSATPSSTPADTLTFTAPPPSPTATHTPQPTLSPMPTATATAASMPVSTETPRPTETPQSTLTPALVPGQAISRSVDNMVMRFVPAGAFLMGADDEEAFPHEKPQHEITLSPFWIDETEVTNAQYRRCVKANICPSPKATTAYDDPEMSNHPVVYVTWEQADAYCRWLAIETGWSVHLPTEAQWEKAASWNPFDESKRLYPWGDDPLDPTLLNYIDSGLAHTAPVGDYPQGASPYGVQDMAGNVWEWVADWYAPEYYSLPNPPPDPTGPTDGTQRVMRGGSYGYGERQARTTNRDAAGAQASGNGLGFRCVVDGERLD